MHAINLQSAKVLVRTKQAKSTKGKYVIIGKERSKSMDYKIWSREVMLKKADDYKLMLKITMKASRLWGINQQLEARSGLCSAEDTMQIN
jgi:hypothetical protein